MATFVVKNKIKIENATDKEFAFRPYRQNFVWKINPGDILELKTKNAGASLQYYKSVLPYAEVSMIDEFDPEPGPTPSLTALRDSQSINGIIVNPQGMSKAEFDAWLNGIVISDPSGILLASIYGSSDFGIMCLDRLSGDSPEGLGHNVIVIMTSTSPAGLCYYTPEQVDVYEEGQLVGTIPEGWSKMDGSYQLETFAEQTTFSFDSTSTTGIVSDLLEPVNGVVFGADEGTGPSPSTYSITVNITDGTYSGDTEIQQGMGARVHLSANQGFVLPDSITVTNASYEYDKSLGEVDLTDATGSVSISCVCEQDQPAGLTPFENGQRISGIQINPAYGYGDDAENPYSELNSWLSETFIDIGNYSLVAISGGGVIVAKAGYGCMIQIGNSSSGYYAYTPSSSFGIPTNTWLYSTDGTTWSEISHSAGVQTLEISETLGADAVNSSITGWNGVFVGAVVAEPAGGLTPFEVDDVASSIQFSTTLSDNEIETVTYQIASVDPGVNASLLKGIGQGASSASTIIEMGNHASGGVPEYEYIYALVQNNKLGIWSSQAWSEGGTNYSKGWQDSFSYEIAQGLSISWDKDEKVLTFPVSATITEFNSSANGTIFGKVTA